jgi:hypothetical protein
MACIFEISTYEDEIRRVVFDIFDSMLRCQTEAAQLLDVPDADPITAAVYFAGSWQGAALIECGRAESRILAARLMRIDGAQLTGEDVDDGMGEIINMIGGNLKSVLPHGVGLSLPSVIHGAAYRICGAHRRETLAFKTDGVAFRLTLVQTDDAE